MLETIEFGRDESFSNQMGPTPFWTRPDFCQRPIRIQVRGFSKRALEIGLDANAVAQTSRQIARVSQKLSNYNGLDNRLVTPHKEWYKSRPVI